MAAFTRSAVTHLLLVGAAMPALMAVEAGTAAPLREREGDVARLARHFAQMYAKQFGKPPQSVSPEALRRLEAYPWPDFERYAADAVIAEGQSAVPTASDKSFSSEAFVLTSAFTKSAFPPAA